MFSLREGDVLLERPLLREAIVQRDPAGNPVAIGSAQDGEYRICFPGLATFAFRRGAREVRFTAPPTTPRADVEALFRGSALPFLWHVEGYEAIHASAVRMFGGVVAFCGFSGTGKTTVAYALTQRSYPMWADDAVILRISSADPEVITSTSLRQAINLRPDSRRFFGLREDADPSVELAPSGDDRLVAVVVLAPEEHATSRMTLLPLDAAFTAILPHAFCFFAEEGRERSTATAYLDLVARVPVLRFRFPRDFVHLEAALDILETSLGETVADL